MHLPVGLLKALIHLLEAPLHLCTQRPQLGEYQGHLFATRECLQERLENHRFEVRAALKQVRQATAEHLDQVFVM